MRSLAISTLLILFYNEALARAGGVSSTFSRLFYDVSIIFFIIIILPFVLLFTWWINSSIDNRAKRTEKLLTQLAKKDPIWNPQQLRADIRDQFFVIQKAWSNQDLEKLKANLSPSLFNDWCSQIEALSEKGEKNGMDSLYLGKVRILLVQNFKNDKKDLFTVCIDARVREYIAKEDGTISHANKGFPLFKGPASEIGMTWFREFWTFIRKDNQWILCRIDKSGSWRNIINTILIDEDRTGPV